MNETDEKEDFILLLKAYKKKGNAFPFSLNKFATQCIYDNEHDLWSFRCRLFISENEEK